MQQNPDPHAIFEAAFSYDTASRDLRRAESPYTRQHIYPSMQLSFVSIELYLKCMVLMFTGQMQRGHELHTLYKRLPVHVKAELTTRWAKAFAESAYAKLPVLPKPPEDLFALLRHANFMQQTSRYPFEKPPSGQHIFMIQELPEVIYDYLSSLKPTWKFPVKAA